MAVCACTVHSLALSETLRQPGSYDYLSLGQIQDCLHLATCKGPSDISVTKQRLIDWAQQVYDVVRRLKGGRRHRKICGECRKTYQRASRITADRPCSCVILYGREILQKRPLTGSLRPFGYGSWPLSARNSRSMETRKREPTLHGRVGMQEVAWDTRMASVVPVRCGSVSAVQRYSPRRMGKR